MSHVKATLSSAVGSSSLQCPPCPRRQQILRSAKLGSNHAAASPRVPVVRTAQVENFRVPSIDSEQFKLFHAPAKPKGAARGATLKLSWAGAGIFFFWQLGAMKWLAERYDLTKVPMVGASGGALAAVLGGCGIDADTILERAYDLSVKNNIWDRPLGLVGVWGSLIEQWLDDLLPDNAAELCRGRIGIVVTEVPSLRQVAITDFKDKADLINVAMTSSHVPMFLDLKMTRRCRGVHCFDGSVPDFLNNANCDLLVDGGGAVLFDYFEDPFLVRRGRMDMLELKSFDEVQRLMQFGYEYAGRLHSHGAFDKFDTAKVKKTIPTKKTAPYVSYPNASLSSGSSIDEAMSF